MTTVAVRRLEVPRDRRGTELPGARNVCQHVVSLDLASNVLETVAIPAGANMVVINSSLWTAAISLRVDTDPAPTFPEVGDVTDGTGFELVWNGATIALDVDAASNIYVGSASAQRVSLSFYAVA